MDRYDANYYQMSPENNPKGPESGQSRVVRGGGWFDNIAHVCSAFRYSYRPGVRYYFIGFRVVIPSEK